MKTGLDIFLAALRSLLDRPAAAFALLLLFCVVDFGLYWLGWQPVGAEFPLTVAIPVASVVVVGLVASTWHRIVLLPGDAPMKTGRALHYAVAWFVLGIVLLLAVLPVMLAFFSVSYFSGYQCIMNTFCYGDGSGPFLLVGYLVIGVPFVWLLYRIGLGLPHIAIGGGDLSFRGSWARTSPLARPIAGLAVIAGVAQLPFLFAYLLFIPTYEDWNAFQEMEKDLDALPPGYFLADIVGTLGYGVVVLVGAAILTELYRRTAPTP